ncbi:hypothetical protein N0V88_006885 [Collariella sp. IMI 366227]|nr:hypothetical protein N0V88_006885 [Collariella sp. IMI 366227]
MASMNRQPHSAPSPPTPASTPYLPYLHQATQQTKRGKNLKWIPPLAAVVTAGYAVATYRSAQLEARLAEEQQADAARRRRDALMADAYGDRGSLEELERAMRVYNEARQ